MSESNNNSPIENQLSPLSVPNAETSSGNLPTIENENLSWWMIWDLAIFHPSEETYKKIAAQKKKYKFLFVLVPSGLAGIFGSVLMVFFMVFVFAVGNTNSSDPIDPSESTGIILLISLLMGLVMVIGLLMDFYLTTGYYFVVAKIFGGSASWDQIVTIMVATYQPLMIISFFLGFIPILNIAALAIPLYLAVVLTIAIKAVNDISWIKAILVGVIIPIVIFSLIYGFCFFVALLPFFQQALTTIQQSGGIQSY